ncbi:hypothetical protein FDP22_19845 (plasmid) [Paroceanicella profunda]|uniref:Peptidoglycan recognition protein family domain-containing protein n=1 Tax=Paroceanicella profunda TaxID=2579971 RepID=A0A5B8G225_9RHOB|nr:N-acetylmuramoyl-L-alanine amidase [Paroceanicella profunda]QDL94114.1 hypothetical protein FDP22_19845 [Paroceanicella profunda]
MNDGAAITLPSGPTALWAIGHQHLRQPSRWTTGQSCTNFQTRPPERGRPIELAQDYNLADIDYHTLIAPDGTLYEGRSLEYMGAHVSGNNQNNIGIAFMGDYSEEGITDEQKDTFIEVKDALDQAYGELGRHTHGFFDDEKRNELMGAKPQIEPMGFVYP